MALIRRINKLKLAAGLVATGSAVAIVRSVDELEDLKEVGFIRFGRATCTVASIVADYKYSLYGLHAPSEAYDTAIKQCHARSAERLLELARANGGVFIKVGQHLASMEYLIPQEYTQTLSVLTSRAPQKPFEEIVGVVEADLGKPMTDLFSEFSQKPIGAASLAQVHLARIKNTGQQVAVKVQHRRVYKNSKTDMRTMEVLARLSAKLFPEFRLTWLVEETKRNLPKELDFLSEAENAKKIKDLLQHLKFLKIPKIYDAYTTKRVLTMEYLPGAQIDDADYMRENNIDTHDVCRKIARMISEMIFLKGYLHADPHPGNVLVNKQRNGHVDIILLDHGLYLTMNEKFKELYSELWLALLKPDLDKIKLCANEMGVGDLYGLFACMVTRRSWRSVTQGIDKSKIDSDERQELRKYAASLIPQISEVLHRMPREMLLILKTNDLMRNIEHKLANYRNDTLIEMSRCVIRAHYTHAIEHSPSRFAALRNRCIMWWALLRLRLYELYLITLDCWPFKKQRNAHLLDKPLSTSIEKAIIF